MNAERGQGSVGSTHQFVWESISASVRGASHDRSGKPNQDAVRCVAKPGLGLVATVCDGHGGDRYVRSDVGARVATEVATELGGAVLDHLVARSPESASAESISVGPVSAESISVGPISAESISAERIKQVLCDSVPVLLAYWRNRVMADYRSRPFDETEVAVGGADLASEPLVAYGCTLVMGIFAPLWVGFIQIGDGDVTAVDGSRVGTPVPADDRLVGNQTTSLCLPSATQDARVAALVGDLPDLVLLSTDGYANSFSSSDWRNSVGVDMLRQLDEHGIDEVERLLPAWLEDSATASGDDVTMALVRRAFDRRSSGAATLERTAVEDTAK
ncbi:MAG: protein phosphatase 2C domain-containing protein [Microthrixaceae bacterium]